MSRETLFWVVVCTRTDKPEQVKRLGPMTRAKAEKVERGMLINMDHERFFTMIEKDANGNVKEEV